MRDINSTGFVALVVPPFNQPIALVILTEHVVLAPGRIERPVPAFVPAWEIIKGHVFPTPWFAAILAGTTGTVKAVLAVQV